jgi:hypothetical protein
MIPAFRFQGVAAAARTDYGSPVEGGGLKESFVSQSPF